MMFGFHCMRKKKPHCNEENQSRTHNGIKSDVNSYSEVNSLSFDANSISLFSQCFKGSKKYGKDFTESQVEESSKHSELKENITVNDVGTCNLGQRLDGNRKILVQQSLAEKLFHLANYGWYWGPLSYAEASAKLQDESDGSFLVRDSSCEQYVLTISFRSHGHIFNTRIDHLGGRFSIQNDLEFNTVEDLINYAMTHSFLANRGDLLDNNNFTIKLTHPISRFTHVRPLQYLCRFVIRQYIRADIIPKLPLPQSIVKFVEESQF